MKKIIIALLLPLVVVSLLSLTNCETKKEPKPTPKTLSMADQKNNLEKRKKWEASPDGIKFKEWQVSPEGKKIYASYDQIKKSIKAFTTMKAIVTSVTFQRPSTNALGPKWLIVDIKGEKYMMQFVPKEFEQLKSLKVNDTITLKSRSVGFSPNHPYLVLSSDYIVRGNKVLFKRNLSKNNGC